MQLQSTWGWLVAVYLFLGGLGAGSFITVAALYLATGERYKSTIRFGAWAGAVAIGAGTLVLLADVGQPLRALVLFKSFVNLNSWMARGAWLLFGAILVDGLFAVLSAEVLVTWLGRLWQPLAGKRALWRTILAVVALPVNLGVAVYTGVLLGALPFRPFWHSWLLPALFTASALDTGVGLIAGYAAWREESAYVDRLRTALEGAVMALVAVEAGVLGWYLSAMQGGAADAARAAQLVTAGAISPLFWVGVVGLGLVVPFLVALSQLSGVAKREAVAVPLVGAVSCLVGGWMLRFIVLSAGLPASLSSPSLLHILAGVRFWP